MKQIEKIEGGIIAAKGFSANGVHCGIRKNKSKKDLAMIYSSCRAATACVYTTNLVKGAPIAVTKQHVADGYAQAIVCNSGNANTCNANGVEIAEQTCALAAEALGIDKEDIVIASTGVIGQPLSLTPFITGIKDVAAGLGAHGDSAAEAIMTTDTVKKECAVEFELGGKKCHIGGIAKGSGMIHPNMATMLVFVTSDVAITPTMLQSALSADIADTFNMLSVDGDTSTNDMVTVMSNGLAGNPLIDSKNEDYQTFCTALNEVHNLLCKSIAADGEGATKMIEVSVQGAKDKDTARKVAKSIVCSSLVKSAIFGSDANWGRILCAIGYSGVQVNISGVCADFVSAAGRVNVCHNGTGVDFDEELARKVLDEKQINIDVTLSDGTAQATAYGCDLTYEYVKINSDYRT